MRNALIFTIGFALLCCGQAQGARIAEKDDIPKVYKQRAKALFNELAADEAFDATDPLTDEQKAEYKEILRGIDAFSYSKLPSLKVRNEKIPVSLRDSRIYSVNLGHTFTTTLVFTDAAGNPWSVEPLTDVSNKDVVSVTHTSPHIITVRPLKMAGQTNLPVKLSGQQRPISILFNISTEEVYFNVDLQVDGLGDSAVSQQISAVSQYSSGSPVVLPKLTIEPEKEQMLQFLTPQGYQDKRIFNEFRDAQDPRDFVAWTKGGKLFLLTPHDSYTPDPIDITASPDGIHKLFEFDEIPVLSVRKGSKIIMLHIE